MHAVSKYVLNRTVYWFTKVKIVFQFTIFNIRTWGGYGMCFSKRFMQITLYLSATWDTDTSYKQKSSEKATEGVLCAVTATAGFWANNLCRLTETVRGGPRSTSSVFCIFVFFFFFQSYNHCCHNSFRVERDDSDLHTTWGWALFEGTVAFGVCSCVACAAVSTVWHAICAKMNENVQSVKISSN